MKAKGMGELGICGVGAAVAKAIYNATGVRVRDYPITLDKLIESRPLRWCIPVGGPRLFAEARSTSTAGVSVFGSSPLETTSIS